jgi:hypothetical protein
VLPYIISLTGVITDFITTRVGLSLGFSETHLQYNPLIALSIFWGVLTLLTLALPQEKDTFIGKTIVASASFLGMMNNILVISGFFSGLII